MSNKTKITGIKLNGWGFLVLAVIIFFFWEPLLIIGGILLGAWLEPGCFTGIRIKSCFFFRIISENDIDAHLINRNRQENWRKNHE